MPLVICTYVAYCLTEQMYIYGKVIGRLQPMGPTQYQHMKLVRRPGMRSASIVNGLASVMQLVGENSAITLAVTDGNGTCLK